MLIEEGDSGMIFRVYAIRIRLELNWHDKWIGAYDKIKLKSKTWKYTYEHHYWICVIPCLPIHVWWPLESDNSDLIEQIRNYTEQ